MTKKSALVSLSVGLFLVGVSTSFAHAVPQVLGLIASKGHVALQCQDGECAATLSAFCLQRSRAMPDTGTPYEFYDTGKVRLVGVRTDGVQVALDAAKELTVVSARRQLAVRVAMPKARLDALGVTGVRIEIGRNVTLMPTAFTGDPNPLSESEIALAAGPLRHAGTRLLEGNEDRVDAAVWVGKLSNGLPQPGVLTAEERSRFLSDARRANASAGLSPAAREQSQEILNICEVKSKLGAYDNLRQCFERHHDTLLWRLNVDYWLAIQHGS